MYTQDGQALTGDTPSEIVASLHNWAFERQVDDQAYMAEAARMAAIVPGVQIRHDTPEHFVEDLLAAGLLVEKPPIDDEPSDVKKHR